MDKYNNWVDQAAVIFMREKGIWYLLKTQYMSVTVPAALFKHLWIFAVT